MRTRYSVLPPLMVSAGMFLAVLAFAPLTTQPLVSATIVLTLTIPGVVGALMALLGMRRLPSLLLSTLAGMIPVLWVGLTSSPHPHPVVGLQELFVSGFSALRNNVLPIPASPGFEWLIAVTALLLWFMTDLLVEVLEQPAWSLVPLALPFTISTVVLPADVPLTGFLLVAGGFTAILLSSSGSSRSRRCCRRQRCTPHGTEAALAAAGNRHPDPVGRSHAGPDTEPEP